MKGKRLFQLVQELTKTEHRQLLNDCKTSTDKRMVALADLLRKRNLTEKSFAGWLDKLVTSWCITSQIEQDKRQRRWVDFACKEIETLLLKNHFAISNQRHYLLSQIFDKRNHEDLAFFYNQKAIETATNEKDYDQLLTELDTELRWLGRNQTNQNISKISELLIKRKSISELRHHQAMSYFYSISSALYIDNPYSKSFQQIIPTPSAFIQIKEETKDDFSKLLYELAEARFNFYNRKKFEKLLEELFVQIESSTCDKASKDKLKRSWYYLSIIAGLYYGYSILQMKQDAQKMFEIQLEHKMHDSIGFFFLLFFNLLEGKTSNYDSLLKKYKVDFFTKENQDYLKFLQAFQFYKDQKTRQCIAILLEITYSKSNYIAIWSKLLELKIHIEDGDTQFAFVLIDRAKRFLTTNSHHRIIYDPIFNLLENLNSLLKNKPSKSLVNLFEYYRIILPKE